MGSLTRYAVISNGVQVYYMSQDKVWWTDLDIPNSKFDSCMSCTEYLSIYTEGNEDRYGFSILEAENIEELVLQLKLLN